MHRTANPARFRRALLAWYRREGRDLPWRRTHDAYAILVSEFMLQQTQVATVLPYYIEWLRRFPTAERLAAASQSDVLHAWQGLGYYSRARNLHAAAKMIRSRQFPTEIASIRALPGVGRYTANAVATFAFDQSVPIVEANTARVLSRLFDIRLPIASTAGRAALWDAAAKLVPEKGAGAYNSALIDLGATVCIARRPKCDICPVRGHCGAADPASLPVKQARRAPALLTENHAFERRRGRVLLEQSHRRWRGLWTLPRLALPPAGAAALYRADFPFTHHRVTLSVFPTETRSRRAGQRWVSINDLAALPMPSPHRRALNALLHSTVDVRR